MDSFSLDGGISPLRFDASFANSSINTSESLTDILGTPPSASMDLIGTKNSCDFSDGIHLKKSPKRKQNLMSEFMHQKLEEKEMAEKMEIHSTFKEYNSVHNVENEVFEKCELLHPVDLQSYEIMMANGGRNLGGKINVKSNNSKDIFDTQKKVQGVAFIHHQSAHNKQENNVYNTPCQNVALKQEKRKRRTKGKEIKGVNLDAIKNASFTTHQKGENVDLSDFSHHKVSSEKENSLYNVRCPNVDNSSAKVVNTFGMQTHKKLEDTVSTKELQSNKTDAEPAKLTDKHSSPIYQYQLSVETIIHDCISSESDKIRQNLYLQQMSFYRNLNKMTEQIQKENVVMSERLLKTVTELSEINLLLKSVAIA